MENGTRERNKEQGTRDRELELRKQARPAAAFSRHREARQIDFELRGARALLWIVGETGFEQCADRRGSAPEIERGLNALGSAQRGRRVGTYPPCAREQR